MKKTIILFSIVFLHYTAMGQNKQSGFAAVSGELFANKHLQERFAINAAAGFATSDKSTLGASFDFFMFGEGIKFVVPRLDARLFFQGIENPKGSMFLAIQPGWVIYNQGEGRYRTRGDLAFGVLSGAFIPLGGRAPKITASAGFSTMGFRTAGKVVLNPGGMIQVGIAF